MSMRRAAAYQPPAGSNEPVQGNNDGDEEDSLNTALFATECVEAGLFFGRRGIPRDKQQKKPHKVGGPCRATTGNKEMVEASCYHYKRRLDVDGSALALWSNLSNLIGYFERYLWVLVPLHPSVLHEDSIRFALLGQPSEMVEEFPLLFNVNVAMACGAYVH